MLHDDHVFLMVGGLEVTSVHIDLWFRVQLGLGWRWHLTAHREPLLYMCSNVLIHLC